MASADDEFMENTGFLDDVVAYYPPLKSGFISIPVSDSAKYGWEKPFTQPPGSVVSKEDKGDAKTQVLFQWKSVKQEWKVKRGLNLSYGNIEFIQKFDTSGNPLKTPLIVTFDGPQNRHMLGEDNTYLNQSTMDIVTPITNPLTKKVYMKGNVLATFPYPVIGVCIRQSVNGKKWLVVATKNGNSTIQFYRYQVGKKDSIESIGTILDEEVSSDVGSVVHFSDSGIQAVAYFRVVASVDTEFFDGPGRVYPDSVDVYATRRVMIQISYNQDLPTSVTAAPIVDTFELVATDDSKVGWYGCGNSRNYTDKSVTLTQEIAAEFKGETLIKATINATFSIKHGWSESKSQWCQIGQYSPRRGWYSLETEGYGWVGNPWECAGVPDVFGVIIACAPWCCGIKTYFLVTRGEMTNYVTYKISLTIDGGGGYNNALGLVGRNSVAYKLDCTEEVWNGYPPALTLALIASLPPSTGGPSICNSHINVWQFTCAADCNCCQFDPIPPIPPNYVSNPTPDEYRPLHILFLDLKRGNYLFQKGVDPNAKTGNLTGQIDGTSVNVQSAYQGSGSISDILDRILFDVGYSYSFCTPYLVGTTNGIFDARHAWEYPAQYPDDIIQHRFGYAVDGYDHVFCCASEPYDAATGISLYPVYAYLSGTDPLVLNQSVGNGARFKKIGVI